MLTTGTIHLGTVTFLVIVAQSILSLLPLGWHVITHQTEQTNIKVVMENLFLLLPLKTNIRYGIFLVILQLWDIVTIH